MMAGLGATDVIITGTVVCIVILFSGLYRLLLWPWLR